MSLNLTQTDILLLKEALENYVSSNTCELFLSSDQRDYNINLALQCLHKINSKAPGLTEEETKTVYSALAFLFDELSEIAKNDPDTPDVLSRLKRLMNALTL